MGIFCCRTQRFGELAQIVFFAEELFYSGVCRSRLFRIRGYFVRDSVSDPDGSGFFRGSGSGFKNPDSDPFINKLLGSKGCFFLSFWRNLNKKDSEC